MGSQFKQRVIMSSLSIASLAFAIYYSHTAWFIPIFVILTAVIISMSVYEFYQLAQHKGFQPLITIGLSCSAIYILVSYLSLFYDSFHDYTSFILLGSLILFFVEFFKKRNNPIANIAITAFGIAYLVLPLTCLLLINYFQAPDMNDGRLWLTYVLVVTKITDMGAYIFGKTVGRTKLAATISPKKTIEGTLGGVCVSLCASVAFHFFVFPDTTHFTLSQSIWLGLLISALAQFGDLAESILKRDAGVKDSSHIPGFGGILDVVDSLVFTLPLLYLLLKMHLIG